MADKIKEWWQSHRPTTRRLAQLYAALLYNANLKGFIVGDINQTAQKAVCVPGFNCYSCPGAIGACPLGSLQNALTDAKHTAPWYMLGILLLFGITLGRTICGWFCPLGLIQELLHKIPTPKIKKNGITRALSYLKYVILAVFVLAIPLWYGVRHGVAMPGFCKYICPAGTLEGAFGLLSNPVNDGEFARLGILFTRKFVIMLMVGAACVFIYRAFCRFICPLGAIYGLFNRFALTGVKVNPQRCNGCGACVRNCQMDVRHVGDHECISCGKCIENCNQGAIALKCGKLTLKGPETGKNADPAPEIAARKRTGHVIWGVALAVLVFALLWFNVIHPPKMTAEAQAPEATVIPEAAAIPEATAEPEKAPEPEATAEPEAIAEAAPVADYTSDAPIGYDVGQQLADFTTPLIGGGEFHLADTRGKVVFINLWGIHCKPCVGELPYFEALKEKHPDVEILAIHLGLFNTEQQVSDFLADKGWDQIKFALDGKDQPLFAVVNGSSKLPQTIVLNSKGEVVFNERRSVTYEMLEQLYDKAGGNAVAPEAAASDAASEPTVTAEPEATAEAAPVADYTSDAPIGYDVGQQLADFTAPLIGGGEFHLADTRGKVVFINLWGIHCKPCVGELPYFEALKEKHPDVEILAIHLGLFNTEQQVSDFLADKGWDQIKFALDGKDQPLFAVVNGSSKLPQTIVLNPKGEVVFNERRSVTYEMLEQLLTRAEG